MAKRREEENALEQAFKLLNEAEIERELSQMEDTSSIRKREMNQYRAHLKELENERKQEEAMLDKLLKEYQEMIEKKKDEARCRLMKAKRDLQNVEEFLCDKTNALFCVLGGYGGSRRATKIQTARS